MGIVKCRDCIYGDCFGGKNRSCVQFPAIGTIYDVSDDFFCFTKGKSKEEWQRENLYLVYSHRKQSATPKE